MTPSVHFLCKTCGARVAREFGEAAAPCERCGTANDVVAVVIGEVLGGWLSAIAHVPV